MRRALATLCSVAAVSAVSFVAAPSALAADTKVHLTITGYRAMVVDEAHGHIFFTSGNSSVTITDLTGANPVTKSGLGGSVGLALSPDGSTVYVAAQSANEIAAIDTTTLAVTTPFTGLSCPRYLAFAGDKLYFSYGCTAGQGNIGSVDFSTVPPTVGTGLLTTTWYGPPYLAAGDPSSTVLVAGDIDTEPNKITVYDVSGGSPANPVSNSTDICENLGSMAVTSSGDRLAIACGAPYHVTVLKTSDMSTVDTYGDTSPYPDGVAISAADDAIAGSFSQHNPNVAVYPLGTPSTTLAHFDLEAGAQGFMAPDGMRFGPSGNLYVVVPTTYPETDFYLYVLHGTTLYPTTVTVNAPATAPRSKQLTVSGAVTSASSLSYPLTLHVTRTDLAGKHTLPNVVTNGSGAYSFHDTPTVGGPVTYAVTYTPGAGDKTHRSGTGKDTVTVSRLATSVTMAVDHTTYHYGQTAHLTAHLGTTYNSKVISIYAQPYGGTKRLVKRANVDTHRNLHASFTMTRRTTFIASFAGDYHFGPTHASRTAKSHAKVVEALAGGYATSNGYRLYHSGDDPVIGAQLYPHLANVCVYFRAQALYGGLWHTVATSDCVLTDYSGIAVGVFTGTHSLNTPYRLRAEWRGNTTALAQNGAWKKVKFKS